MTKTDKIIKEFYCNSKRCMEIIDIMRDIIVNDNYYLKYLDYIIDYHEQVILRKNFSDSDTPIINKLVLLINLFIINTPKEKHSKDFISKVINITINQNTPDYLYTALFINTDTEREEYSVEDELNEELDRLKRLYG